MTISLDGVDRWAGALELGRVQFTRGRFFAAHETWEEAWRQASGSARRLLQGLIMAAAAYHKMATQHQPRGMVILLQRALEQLGPLPDGYGGLELDRFRAGLERSLLEGRAWLGGAPAPAGPAPLGTYLSSQGDERAAAPVA